MSTRILAVVAALLAVGALAFAQKPDPKLTFEVASVKTAGPPAGGGGMTGGAGSSNPGRLTIPRATLADLLARAYDVWPDQISGPAWLSDRSGTQFEVIATMPPGTTQAQQQVMLQNLIAERFQVKLHHETQTRPGYELVVASGGAKLKEWKPEGAAAAKSGSTDGNGFLRLGGTGTGMAVHMTAGPSPIKMSFRDTMDHFCRGLGSNINASNGIPIGGAVPRVANKTGLTGIYEFTLEFAGTLFAHLGTPAPPADAAVPNASDPTEGAPNIFKAVEQQLGLKLQKVKDVPVDILVIDHAEKVPTGN